MVSVAVAFAIYLNSKVHDTEIDAVTGLLYIADYRYAFFPVPEGTPLTHIWSLSVEEQFYIFWPFLLISLLAFGGRRFAFWVCSLLIIIVILWRFFLLNGGANSSFYRVYFSFDTRIDEILIGCCLALWGYRPGATALRHLKVLLPMVIGFIAMLIVSAPISGRSSLSSYPLIGASVAFLIIIVTSDPDNVLAHLLSFPPIVALGRISYGVYLWHYLIFQEISLDGKLLAHKTLLTSVLTLAVAIASYVAHRTAFFADQIVL